IRRAFARGLAAAQELVALCALPGPVRRFYLRAMLTALATRDRFSLVAHARPRELRALLGVAGGAADVVELGTGTAWTAVALVLADPARRVETYDPKDFPERERYLRLAPPSARERIVIRAEAGESGPSTPTQVDLLFVDIGRHTREQTVAAFEAWEPS